MKATVAARIGRDTIDNHRRLGTPVFMLSDVMNILTLPRTPAPNQEMLDTDCVVLLVSSTDYLSALVLVCLCSLSDLYVGVCCTIVIEDNCIGISLFKKSEFLLSDELRGICQGIEDPLVS